MALVKKAISQTTISLTIAKQTAYFTQGTDTVLCYQIAPPKTDSAHWRPHYVHPLYLPDGTMLTEDYPQDHPHHHGIFWAWHQLFVGEKTLGDAWDIRQFNWQVTQVTADTAKGLAKTLNSHVLWSSPLLPDSAGKPIPLVREQTSITVYPSVQNYRIVDFKICLQALLPDVRIGGSANDKGYGGFSARMRMAEHMQFIGTDGDVVPLKLPITAGPWLDISGPIGRNDSIAGLCIMAHSNNPGHPNPWILRTQRSMQNAVYPHPGATPIPLPNDSSTTLRYRLVLHQGLLTTAQLNALYANFAKHR